MTAPAQPKTIDEVIEILKVSIDSGEPIDPFTYKKYESIGLNVASYSEKFQFFGFLYGSVRREQEAIDNFRKAASFGNITAARNYLAYLAKTRNYDLYHEEVFRLATELPDTTLCIRARNTAYSFGDIDKADFFVNKAIAMTREDSHRESLRKENQEQRELIEKFMGISGLSKEDLLDFNLLVVNLTRKYQVNAISHDFYCGVDGNEAAVICEVVCQDPEILSALDIDIATEIATNSHYCSKNITAWFSGVNESSIEAI